MDDNIKVITTEEELKVFNDPYRMKIIREFQRSETPLTVKGCADILGEVPAKVHYHVQKMLKVNFLELDHVEVVNGINAKYYKLPHKQFTISLKEDESDILKRMPQIHSILHNMLEDFKESFMKSSALAVESQKEDTSYIVANQLELTEEEFIEVREYITNLATKYNKKREDTFTYKFLVGLSKEESKK